MHIASRSGLLSQLLSSEIALIVRSDGIIVFKNKVVGHIQKAYKRMLNWIANASPKIREQTIKTSITSKYCQSHYTLEVKQRVS